MKLKAILGFARKARKLTIGRKATIKALKKGKVRLILLARDAGKSICRELLKYSQEAKINAISICSKRELGKAIGRENCSVLGLMDWRMAQEVMLFEQNKGLRASENNRAFNKGPDGKTKGTRSRGKDTHEHNR